MIGEHSFSFKGINIEHCIQCRLNHMGCPRQHKAQRSSKFGKKLSKARIELQTPHLGYGSHTHYHYTSTYFIHARYNLMFKYIATVMLSPTVCHHNVAPAWWVALGGRLIGLILKPGLARTEKTIGGGCRRRAKRDLVSALAEADIGFFYLGINLFPIQGLCYDM